MAAGFNGSSGPSRDPLPMQHKHIVMTVLLGWLIIGAACTGYVVAQFTAGYSHSRPFQNAANPHPGPRASPGMSGPAPMAPAMPAIQGGSRVFSDPSLAQSIAERTGAGLAGNAPQNVPVSQVKALSEQVPAGAGIDTRTNTITFTAAAVYLTVLAIAPGRPDMTFTVAALTNPTIVVPSGARVTVHFINNDTDEAHGWLITDSMPPFTFGQSARPAIAGATAGVIGDPTSAGDGANTITFTATGTGHYEYICPMPGHAQMGMHGSFIVG
jgi:rusticyanin